MWQTIVNAFKIKEVRRKILITIALLFVYRIGCYIPVPGITALSDTALDNYSYFQIMGMMSGGALSQGTLFAMGSAAYSFSVVSSTLAISSSVVGSG